MRTARIAYREDESIGVCIFLTVEQLQQIGIDPSETEQVEYSVRGDSGAVALLPENTEWGAES